MEGESLSNNEVIDETLLFFVRIFHHFIIFPISSILIQHHICSSFQIAGHETTTSTLAWISYMIQDKDQVKQKIRQEYNDLIGDKVP